MSAPQVAAVTPAESGLVPGTDAVVVMGGELGSATVEVRAGELVQSVLVEVVEAP